MHMRLMIIDFPPRQTPYPKRRALQNVPVRCIATLN
jgi:hypothetical protein